MKFLIQEAVLAASLTTGDPTSALCLARNGYFEGRGESVAGQTAIAHVVLNRVRSPKFPNTICAVVEQRKQFSWWSDGKSDRPDDWPAFEISLNIAASVLAGTATDETQGATHYFAHGLVWPGWAKEMATRARIGGHTFKAKCEKEEPAPECIMKLPKPKPKETEE